MNIIAKKFYTGTNFWFALLMFAGSIWGLSEDLAAQTIGAGVSIVAVFGAARQFFKTAEQRKLSAWIADANTRNYLIAILVSIVPKAGELSPQLNDVFRAFESGNWANITTAIFSLLTMGYFIFIKK
jgi:hypothetical protein